MTQPRRGLQGNPLDAVIPNLRAKSNSNSITAPAQTPAVIDGKGGEGGPRPRLARRRFTAHVCDEVIERAKNAVYWTPGLTMAELVERGMELVIKDLEKKNGKVFESRREENRGGRPLV